MNLIQGAQLKKGARVSLISGLAGITGVGKRAEQFIVSDMTDKKGNAVIVNLRTGVSASASPLSVWEVLA